MKQSGPRIEPPRSYTRPDGGWGWFIILATFTCYVCVAGTTKSNGLFFVYFLEKYGASNSATSAITFVQKLSETFTALIWSILAERYGSRVIVFAGAITITVGSLLSSFANNILFITITYGVICGISISMINYPAVQMLPRYFEKRLVIATALIYCGTPVGSLTVPYIISVAVSTYGLSGAFIILAGIQLHIFVAAALLRPLYIPVDVPIIEETQIAVTDADVIAETELENRPELPNAPLCACRSVSQCFHKANSCGCMANENGSSPVPSANKTTEEEATLKRLESVDEVTITGSQLRPPAVSAVVSPSSIKKGKRVTLQSNSSAVVPEDEDIKPNERFVRHQSSNAEGLRMRRLRSQLSTGSVSSVAAVENMAVSFAIMDNMSMASRQNVTAIGRQLSSVPFNQLNSMPVGTRSALRAVLDPKYSKCSDHDKGLASRAVSIAGIPATQVPSQPTPPSSGPSEPSEPALDEEFLEPPSTTPSIFRALVNKYRSIVRDRLFLLLAFSNFLHAFGISLWVIFQQAYLVDVGYHDNFRQIFLIIVSSFAELASRLSLGFAISRNWMKVYRWNQIACCLMALAMFTYPFITSYSVMVVYNCFVASVFSINVVTSMPNLKEFLGIDMAALGQGLMVVPAGFGIVSVQIGGALRDITGSFVPSFYMAAFALLLSAANFQLIGFLSHHQHLPFWMCFFCSEKDVSDDHIVGVVTETLLSNNAHDGTHVSSDGIVDKNHLQVPSVHKNKTFTDEVIEMLQRDQTEQQQSENTENNSRMAGV